MIPWERLDSATIPDSAQTMELWRRGDELVIRVDGKELMGSRAHGSEDALATLALAHLDDAQRDAARVLVGGRGLGFTLAAALGAVGQGAQILTAELVPAIIDWNRGPLGHLAGHPLDDPRATLHTGDVADLIRAPGERFDAILLDVDNGPDWLTREGNRWLYSPRGLQAIERALRPRGTLAVWSATDDDAFTKRLAQSSLALTKHTARSHNGKGRRHTIWIGQRA